MAHELDKIYSIAYINIYINDLVMPIIIIEEVGR